MKKSTIPLGQPVTIYAKLRRITVNNGANGRKIWQRVAIEKQEAIFLGMRRLTEGDLFYNGDGRMLINVAYVQSALVVLSTRTAPIYVPVVAMTVNISDKQLLDLFQERAVPGQGGWVARDSITGRGLRLHQSAAVEEDVTVRDALLHFAEQLLD